MQEPDPVEFLTRWDFASVEFATVALAAAAVFVGVARAGARGRPIPRPRVAALVTALVIGALATAGGVARYETALFSAHALQHVMLGLVVPVLLAAAGPITIAMRASDATGRVRIARALASPPARFFVHPIVAWLLFVPPLYVLYFSSMYELSLHHAWIHVLVHAHFVTVGYLFFASVIVTDPRPRPLSHGGRLLYLVSTVPFHVFLGVAILSATELVGGTPPTSIAGVDLLNDQRVGGALLWISSELVVGVLVVVVAAQWAASDVATAAREDRAVAQESFRGV